MKVQLQFNKSVDENASIYYEKAKKAKSKLDGIKEAISSAEKKKEQEMKKKLKEIEKEEAEKTVERKKEWYEKFHWFLTSYGKLVIGGRDATTNENVIKKHTDKDDLVFHTDMAGSPFMVIKSDGREIHDIEKEETSEFLSCFSKAWKAGISSVEVFYVSPDQVTKEAQAGEYLSKGSFMIKGKTSYIHATLKLGVTLIDDVIHVGPPSALRATISRKFPDLERKDIDRMILNIVQGSSKTSNVAKEIRKRLGGGELDEIIRSIPPGGCRIGK